MILRLVNVAALALIILGSSAVQASDWIQISEKTVNYKTETDTVTPKKAEKQVSHVKLKCVQGTVNMHKIILIMADGNRKEVDNLGVLTKGLSSRSISVPDGDLKSIELTYDSVGSQTLGVVGATKKGKLKIMGKTSNDG
ncbi:hypothetical protein L2719_06870 [Shewanella schlegeliana]|uniref:Uncharacterized protein n=1 Tax=Shewanella schlegeliana TaxID=190308 RepID=A0ABS1SZI2_9GAMM|nr:hypothetical protein [Shewanella schlegeliana]MBL4913309.1 hypothetical protein [Shewanella schlegeliana]MCL1109264.1 hypothetical protein [Shewanella schlegeliana]GIU24627.1 hypothetical protein TUM4433_08510 [Shewanella schlegeliana]